jgi:pyruvate/2-oxoglutarate dehydrogenase complex dihydrolipoamide dehydrogenase (E3) component
MAERFDAIVVGAGPAGEAAISRLAAQGLDVALVERELIGGECAYWACIPSKTLLRPPETRWEARRAAGVAEPSQDWTELVGYRDFMVRHLDDSAQVEGYQGQGVTVVKASGRIAGPGRVAVDGRSLESERIVIATGSDAKVPPVDGLEEAGYWTNRQATNVHQVPESLVILGGGPVGIELGQFFRRVGTRVTIVEDADRLLPREEKQVSELILDALREEGIEVRLGVRAEAASVRDGDRVLRLSDGSEVSGRELLVAVGRVPRTHDLGLETIGIEPDRRGIGVDERCRAAEGVWAIGDVTGVMPFTHVGKYQGRIATADIAGARVSADYHAIPRVVFSDPEIGAVGRTEQQARDDAIDVATSRINLPDTLARPWTYETTPRGEMGLVADRERKVLIGAWAVAPMAGEWIHQAALAIKAQIPLAVLLDTVAQFPTYSEAQVTGIEALGLISP